MAGLVGAVVLGISIITLCNKREKVLLSITYQC
jgi:hypothetical protein